jgi:hypothetical protein
MTYSLAINTTLYLFIAPDDGGWFTFLERIHLEKGTTTRDLVSPKHLVASPFLVHAIIAGIALEQARKYASDMKVKLVAQISIAPHTPVARLLKVVWN